MMKLAMLVSGFPRRSETFALNELLALERAGCLEAVFATKPGDPGPPHPGAEGLMQKVQYLAPGTAAEQAAEVVERLNGADVSAVHGYFAHLPTEVAAKVARRLGVPYGFSVHAVDDTSGYVPRIVRETIDALGEVGHYTFVSSISVYADASTPPTEASPVAELKEPTEEWREAYGELKADCEDVVRERFANAFIPRPGLIVGPWDPSGRFTYWPGRFADGGRVLAPAPPDADAQVIDARDLADWIVRAAESGLAGTYNAVDRPIPRSTLVDTCQRVAGVDADVVWVDGAFLTEHDVGEWIELPLWLVDPAFAGMLSVDPSAAFAAGLAPRPLEETVRDTLAWIAAGDAPEETPAGLDRAKEQAVLDAWLSKR